MLSCYSCRYTTNDFKEYINHQKIHGISYGIIICGYPNCRQRYRTEESFRAHLNRTHDFKFTDRSLKLRLRIDCADANGKYVCSDNLCNKQFDCSFDLINHMKTHIRNGSAIRCPFKKCKSKQYDKITSFSSHITRHHRTKNLQENAERPEIDADQFNELNGTCANIDEFPDVTNTSSNNQLSMGECSQQQTNFRDTLWDKIPSEIMTQCQQGVRVSEDQKRELVTLLKIYMINDLKDATRGTAHAISKVICEKYPKSFEEQIDGVKLGKGYEGLATRLYNAVGNASRKRKAVNQKPRDLIAVINSDNEDTDGASRPKSKKRDKYGCAEDRYDPQLPPSETVGSLEAKCIKLIAYHNDSIDSKDERIRNLLNDTYVLQRRSMILSTGIDDGFFAKWPYLQNASALFRHAEELLGIIDVQEMWQTALLKYADAIKKFVKA